MADVVHEFYSQKGLTYSDIVNGVNIASTSGSQTAVVRDVAIKTTASKKVILTVDDIEIGSTSETVTLSGTELLKSSQNLKLKPGLELAWTGMICNNQGTHTTEKQYWKIKSSQYFEPPVDSTDATQMALLQNANYNDTQGTWRSGGGAIPSASTFSNGITVWPASNMFGKDIHDLYFSRVRWYAMGNSGQNQLYYYDDSAGTSTLVAGEETDRKGWCSGNSNRYLIRPYTSGSNMSKFDVYDTHTNTYTHDRNVRNYNNTSNANLSYYDNEGSQISIMDQYVFIKHVHMSSNYGGTVCALMDITTGAHISWTNHADHTKAFCSQHSSYRTQKSYAQIAKDTNGTYYVLWMFIDGSNTAQSQAGVQVIELGATPGALISGNKGGSTYPSLLYRFSDPNVTWTDWKLNGTSMGTQYGWNTGFHPFKRMTPTNSGARYWLCWTEYGAWVIDLEQPPVATFGRAGLDYETDMTIKQLQWKHSGGSNAYAPGAFGTNWKLDTMSLDYNGTEASSAYGTFDVRCTGILSS